MYWCIGIIDFEGQPRQHYLYYSIERTNFKDPFRVLVVRQAFSTSEKAFIEFYQRTKQL